MHGTLTLKEMSGEMVVDGWSFAGGKMEMDGSFRPRSPGQSGRDSAAVF